jgi:hypothetical protein
MAQGAKRAQQRSPQDNWQFTLQRDRDLFQSCRPSGYTGNIGEIGFTGPEKIVSIVSSVSARLALLIYLNWALQPNRTCPKCSLG